MECPDCGILAKTLQGLTKHYVAVHHLPSREASGRALKLFAGESVQLLPMPDYRALDEAAAGIDRLEWARFGRHVVAGLARTKHLPKAQFERRVDSLLAPFMPDVIRQEFGGSHAQLVAPEFPLKKAVNAQSTNADGLFICTGERNAWVLAEIKTDPGSFSETQLRNYVLAREAGMRSLYDDVVAIHHRSTAKLGYWRLLHLIREAAEEVGFDAPIELFYLVPDGLKADHLDLLLGCGVRVVTFGGLAATRPESEAAIWRLTQQLLGL